MSRERVRQWRDRWHGLAPIPLFELSVEERLEDLPRPGAPSASRLTNAAKSRRWPAKRPQRRGGLSASGRRANWPTKSSNGTLLRPSLHGTRRGFLKEASIRPHLSRYWLNTEKGEDFEDKSAAINALYQAATGAGQAGRDGHLQR